MRFLDDRGLGVLAVMARRIAGRAIVGRVVRPEARCVRAERLCLAFWLWVAS